MFTGFSFEAVMLSLRYVFRFRFNNSSANFKEMCKSNINLIFLGRKDVRLENPPIFTLRNRTALLAKTTTL
jgi:hypothetical protein